VGEKREKFYMVNFLSPEDLRRVNEAGSENKNMPVPDRLVELSHYSIDQLGCFSIFNQSLASDGIAFFFTICNLPFTSDEQVYAWVLLCLERALIEVEYDSNRVFLYPVEEVRFYFERELPTEIKKEYHLDADKFYVEWLMDIASQLDIEIPKDDKTRRAFLIGPQGLLSMLIHSPQYNGIFISSLRVAVSWQEHLFELNAYQEAADLVNMACFAIARDGQRQFTESLLARTISVTKGLPNLVSRINLATLLREESKIDSALKIYLGTIVGLLKIHAYLQLVTVISEMGAIYRQKGQLFHAAVLLELCSILHGILKNPKNQAITRSQLASVYRYLRFFGLAIRASKLACSHFRRTDDLLNLGRSLCTQGNIFYNLGMANSAMISFDEALTTGTLISDPQTICGSLSGKARVYLLINNLQEVKPLLEEVIAIRQRNSDHSVGVEYQNMGAYYEKDGNLNVALVWYKKALKTFEQYTPVEVAACKNNIASVEKKLLKKRKPLKK
jgi:tetratricopeptide (TPR) repeat protein